MEKQRTKFSGTAAAIEMIAVILAIVAWIEFSKGTAVVVTVGSLLLLAFAVFLRWHGFVRERAIDREWLKARAVVDEETKIALRDAEIPPAFVRAVDIVGDQKTLRRFRIRIKKECGPELSSDQLITILRAARAAPKPASVTNSSTTVAPQALP